MRNALSVDVEDYFQVGAFETVIDRADWETLPRRVELNTDRVLDLFAEAGVKATFFTLGWVAERHPALIRRIAEAGHEVASHGWDHKRVFTMTAEEFRADIARARAVLEDASGQKVSGYRAPSFSIDQRTPWAHEMLAEEGYAYSSSVAPIAHDHYGWRSAPRFAWRPIAGRAADRAAGDDAGARQAADGGRRRRLLPAAALFRLEPGGAAGQPRRAAGDLLFPPLGDRSGAAARARRADALQLPPLHQSRSDAAQAAAAAARA